MSKYLLGLLAVMTLTFLALHSNKATEENPFLPQDNNTTCHDDCCKKLPSRLPMTFYYYQKTGKLVGGSGNSTINTHGYSGQGAGYLNPDMQCVVNTGPLPAAKYKITYCKNVMHETVTRPCSFYL